MSNKKAARDTLDDILSGVVQEAQRKIAEGLDGDTERLILVIVLAVLKRIDALKTNPMIKLGEFCEDYPKLAWISFMILWTITGAASALVLVGVAKQLGVMVVPVP